MTTKKRYIKPAKADLIVRRLDTAQPLPPDGDWVNWNSHWQRRLAEGSVVEAKPPKPASKPAAKAPAKKETD